MEDAKSDIEGKITIFKTLALSKVVYLEFLTVVPNHIKDELIKFRLTCYLKEQPGENQA